MLDSLRPHRPTDCSLPSSSVHGIFQARILEWVAMSFSRDPPNPGIRPASPELQTDSLPLSHQGSPSKAYRHTVISDNLSKYSTLDKTEVTFPNKIKAVHHHHAPALSLCRLQEAMSRVTSHFSPMALRKGSMNTQHGFPVPARQLSLLSIPTRGFVVSITIVKIKDPNAGKD